MRPFDRRPRKPFRSLEVYVSDLVVVGGGIIGLSVAREAAIRGFDVTLVERTRPGREASWAAAGMLSPLAEARDNGPFLDFALASLRLYATWVATLEEDSGRTVEYRESGKLRLALSEADETRLAERVVWAEARGLSARWLPADAVRSELPAASPEVRGGVLFEEDFRVDNRRLAEALVESARSVGVRILSGVTVAAVDTSGDRVVGVRTEGGDELATERVVIAAGAWSGEIEGVPGPAIPPVRPVRGQMLSLQLPEAISDRVIESEDVYLIPRDDGRLLVGATAEEVGFEPGVTAEGIRFLLTGMLRLFPTLGSTRVAEFWSGFRPGTPDGNPILGPAPGLDGLYLATGHFRNGVLLAPLTASVVAGLIEGKSPWIPDAFSPERFLREPPG